MRQIYLSFIAILMFVLPATKCSELGKDGFNFYKDFLRSRFDDNLPEEPLPERMLYFYRTPAQLHSGFIPNTEQEYKKRTGNVFKNYMLNKDIWTDEIRKKETSKTALSLMLQGKQPYNFANDISEDGMKMPALQLKLSK